MTFKQWLFSELPNPHHSPYTIWYGLALIFIVSFVIISTILLKNKSQRTKRNVLLILVLILTSFELIRRGVNLYKTTDYSLHNTLHILLPRPGCAISGWLVIFATLSDKKWFYTFAAQIGLLCGLIFFISPGAGFNRELIQFEEVYSMVSHILFFTCSICFVTYQLAEFKFKYIRSQALCFMTLICYVAFEMITKIESDPFCILPNGDVHSILSGLPYWAFAVIAFAFLVIFFTSFYLINDRKAVNKFLNKK